jgi:uncharacterized protein (TIGR02646 family)
MRLLDRSESPDCLALKNYEIHAFESLSPGQKRAIWRSLIAMQDVFCAYCEKIIVKRNRQIEHFYPKGDSPDGVNFYESMTFDWSNLFGGCLASEHCGQHKDRDGELSPRPYSPSNLIKPDEHDPSLFFLFSPEGDISLKDGLDAADVNRGKETMRVFNLNTPSLSDSRKSNITVFNLRLKAILSIAEQIPIEAFEEQISELKKDIGNSEHRTAVNGVLFG